MIEIITTIRCDVCGEIHHSAQEVTWFAYICGTIARSFPAGWNIVKEKLVCPKHEVFVGKKTEGNVDGGYS